MYKKLKSSLLLFVIFISAHFTVTAQEVSPKDMIYSKAEVRPEFPGGDQELSNWLNANMRFPIGTSPFSTNVKFVIKKDGTIDNIRFNPEVNQQTEDKIKLVLLKMPKWTPAKMNGVPVNYEEEFPFELNPPKSAPAKKGNKKPVSKKKK